MKKEVDWDYIKKIDPINVMGREDMNLEEFVFQFFEDIGIEKVKRHLITQTQVGCTIFYNLDSLKKEISELKVLKDQCSICDDLYIKSRSTKYGLEAFKLYCLLTDISLADGIYTVSITDMSFQAFRYINNLIK